MLTRVLPALSISKAPLAALIAVCRARPGPAPPSPPPPAAAMAAGTQISVAARSRGELKKRGDETGSAAGEGFRRDLKTEGMHRKPSSGSSGPQGGAIRGGARRAGPAVSGDEARSARAVPGGRGRPRCGLPRAP